jgi:hypothetical protein
MKNSYKIRISIIKISKIRSPTINIHFQYQVSKNKNMAYTDFTNFAQLKAEFGLTYQRKQIFDKIKLVPLEPTDILKARLRRAQHL